MHAQPSPAQLASKTPASHASAIVPPRCFIIGLQPGDVAATVLQNLSAQQSKAVENQLLT
jgi:hypothetical protein